MSGQLIGNRYRVLRKIGEGGMAVVHLAVDEKLGRDIAIKILKERYENHDEVRSRFQHEAKVVSSFDHPNILKIYDFSGENSKQLWIVTELIHGRNVAQILETTPSGWLHPVIAASITREICRALATAHEQGIVHRDVKPENVMITHQGGVKLMDFGIAKIQRINSMTQTGMFMGSPSYMSPEQIRGRDIDQRSDIYSLGVLLYEVITGRLPYTGSSTADVAMRILSGEYTHPRYIMSGLPVDLNDLAVSCMQLSPDARPQSIEDVGTSLDRFLQSLGLESSALELVRCFKDPLAYGERLSKLLQVTHIKNHSTVLVDEFIPPKSPAHSPAAKNKPDSIAKHLPERRHKQRTTQVLRDVSPINVAHQTQELSTLQNASGEVGYTKQNSQKPIPPPKSFDSPRNPAPVQQNAQTPPPPALPRFEMRRIARSVPPLPRRQVRHVRYVIHESPSSSQGMSFLGKFTALLLIAVAGGIIWTGFNRNNDSPRNRPSTAITKPNKPVIATRNDHPKQAETEPSQSKHNPEERTEKPEVKPPQVKPEPSSKANKGSESTSSRPKKPKKANDGARPPTASVKPQETSKETKPAEILPPPSSNIPEDKETPDVSSSKPQTSAKPEKTPNPESDKNSESPKARVKIVISSQPAAELFIDGKRYGTTNDQGTSSQWIDILSGSHKLELRRSGYSTKTETINISSETRQRFGPYVLQRGESSVSAHTSYKITLLTSTPPVGITIVNLETKASQSFTLSQGNQSVTLPRGIYEVVMTHQNEQRRKRLELGGSNQQLTLSADFKASSKPNPSSKPLTPQKNEPRNEP